LIFLSGLQHPTRRAELQFLMRATSSAARRLVNVPLRQAFDPMGEVTERDSHKNANRMILFISFLLIAMFGSGLSRAVAKRALGKKTDFGQAVDHHPTIGCGASRGS
jgi:hypothetical protein